jgi:hypothetical protein
MYKRRGKIHQNERNQSLCKGQKACSRRTNVRAAEAGKLSGPALAPGQEFVGEYREVRLACTSNPSSQSRQVLLSDNCSRYH